MYGSAIKKEKKKKKTDSCREGTSHKLRSKKEYLFLDIVWVRLKNKSVSGADDGALPQYPKYSRHLPAK